MRLKKQLSIKHIIAYNRTQVDASNSIDEINAWFVLKVRKRQIGDVLEKRMINYGQLEVIYFCDFHESAEERC
jgi:hypothetical protein